MRKSWPLWVYPVVGVVSGIVGLLPWLITGMRLPLQNLWAVEVQPEAMPRALLPFSQYAITRILGMIVFGAALAGIITRRASGRRGRPALLAALGVLIVGGIATVQTAATVENGLEQSSRGLFYLLALVGVSAVSILIGLVTLFLLAVAPRPGASIAGTVAALAAGIWVNGLIVPFGTVGGELQAQMLSYSRWLPAILVGLVLAWCGLRTVGSVIAWIVDLGLLWLTPAGLIAIGYGTGNRVLVGDPLEAIMAGAQVFVAALRPSLAVGPLLVAVLIGVVGQFLLRRRVSAP